MKKKDINLKNIGISNNQKTEKNIMLANRINDCVSYLNSQTRYILSKILVQRAILVGFLINQEELLRGEKFNTF